MPPEKYSTLSADFSFIPDVGRELQPERITKFFAVETEEQIMVLKNMKVREAMNLRKSYSWHES